MMRMKAALVLGVASSLVAACGSSEPEPVVEQIVIRAPGEPAANAARKAATMEAGKVDLVALGERAFAQCAGCHVAEKGARGMAGPNLHGVVGRKAAALDDFGYSNALKSSGITWDIAALDRFLANPAGYVEGTSMVAGAVGDGETRAAIVAYLASTSE